MSIEKPHFDKLVGIKDILNIPDDVAREEAESVISDTLENEGGKFIDGLELEKTEKDKEMIELASQKVDEYMRQYGRENVPKIPLNNIHLLKEGGTEEHTKGDLNRGGANSALNSVIIDHDTSNLHLAQTLFHELYHQKSYKALQITKSDEQKFASYHTGFNIVSRNGENIYFKDIDEALTSLAEQKFFEEILMNDEQFRAEIEGMSEEEKAGLFTRNDEREKLNSLVDKLLEANQNEFGSRDEILKMFFEAQATGRLLKIARLIEKTFGKGSFREIGKGKEVTEITDYDIIAENAEKEMAWKRQLERTYLRIDGLGKRIDDGIRKTVAAFNINGLPTSASCEGHIGRGKNTPWIDIATPNEPEERYINENKIFQKIADEYGVPIKHVRKINNKEAWMKASKESIKAGETEEFKEWARENTKLTEKAEKLLEEFYQNREVESDIRLRIKRSASGARIYNGKEEDNRSSVKKEMTEEQKQELSDRVVKYKEEMDVFADFLKEKFFSHEKKSGEKMSMPELIIGIEKGEKLLSIALKGINPEWGEQDHPLAKQINQFFKENPVVASQISDLFNNINSLQQNGFDEETLYILSLTYNNPERMEDSFVELEKYKEIEKPLARNLREKLMNALDTLNSLLPQNIKENLQREFNNDLEKRKERLTDTKKQVKNLIEFYRPNSSTTQTKILFLASTDFMYDKNSGHAFNFGDVSVIISHIDNLDNFEHEFSHGIINPIIDKLSKHLTNRQKQLIIQLSSGKLKEDYGNEYYSLLCEELIRTYNDIFKKGLGMPDYSDFFDKISQMNEKQFQGELKRSKSLAKRCSSLNIKTLDDLKNKSEEYFKKYEASELRNIIYNLYKEYSEILSKNTDINFEKFLSEKLLANL